MKNLITQKEETIGDPFTGVGEGPLRTGENAVQTFTNFISTTIGLLTIIGIIWFIFVLITGAIGMIGAGGDKAALESSRKRIASGLIGLVVLIAAIFLIDLIGTLLGIKQILNIPILIDQILK